MKLLIVICDRILTDKVLKTLKEDGIKYHMSFYGKGTADTTILSYFGLERSEKEVVLSLVEGQYIQTIMEKLGAHDFVKNHGAVAFAIPLDGISKKTFEFLKTMGEEK